MKNTVEKKNLCLLIIIVMLITGFGFSYAQVQVAVSAMNRETPDSVLDTIPGGFFNYKVCTGEELNTEQINDLIERGEQMGIRSVLLSPLYFCLRKPMTGFGSVYREWSSGYYSSRRIIMGYIHQQDGAKG